MTALTPTARRVRTLVRASFWGAAIASAVLLCIALGYALFLVWPAYLVGGLALAGIYLRHRRSPRHARRLH